MPYHNLLGERQLEYELELVIKQYSIWYDIVEKKLHELNIQDEDVRMETVQEIQATILNSVLSLRSIVDKKITSLLIPHSWDPNTKDLGFASIHINSKFYPLSRITFYIDECLRTILIDKLNKKIGDTYKISDNIKSLEEKCSLKLDGIKVLINLRNCFHNGGLHTSKDASFTIQNIVFEFKKGKVGHYFNHQYIFIILHQVAKELLDLFVKLGKDLIPKMEKAEEKLDQVETQNNLDKSIKEIIKHSDS